MAKKKRRVVYDASDKVRPTPERRRRGNWQEVGGKAAVERYVRDVAAHPIDDLEHRGVISRDQADAGRDFERLYRAQCEISGMRDSTTIWEPKGHDETDGPVEARERYAELCQAVGKIREAVLRRVCVFQVPLIPGQEGELRECLNESARFFGYGKK